MTLKLEKLSPFSNLVKGTIQETIGQSQFCQPLPGYVKSYFTSSYINILIDDHQMLADKQWGCRSHRKAKAFIFLELKKAFDTVNHEILLEKLCLYGVHDNILSLLKSYLSNRVDTLLQC